MPKDQDTLQSLPNIGKVLSKQLRSVGIETKQQFLALDPYEVFDLLLAKDPTCCRCVLAAVVGAAQGVKWHEVTKEAARNYQKLHPTHHWSSC